MPCPCISLELRHSPPAFTSPPGAGGESWGRGAAAGSSHIPQVDPALASPRTGPGGARSHVTAALPASAPPDPRRSAAERGTHRSPAAPTVPGERSARLRAGRRAGGGEGAATAPPPPHGDPGPGSADGAAAAHGTAAATRPPVAGRCGAPRGRQLGSGARRGGTSCPIVPRLGAGCSVRGETGWLAPVPSDAAAAARWNERVRCPSQLPRVPFFLIPLASDSIFMRISLFLPLPRHPLAVWQPWGANICAMRPRDPGSAGPWSSFACIPQRNLPSPGACTLGSASHRILICYPCHDVAVSCARSSWCSISVGLLVGGVRCTFASKNSLHNYGQHFTASGDPFYCLLSPTYQICGCTQCASVDVDLGLLLRFDL